MRFGNLVVSIQPVFSRSEAPTSDEVASVPVCCGTAAWRSGWLREGRCSRRLALLNENRQEHSRIRGRCRM